MRIPQLLIAALLLLSTIVSAQTPAGVPIYQITPVKSKIDCSVKASIALEGAFEKCDATLSFTSDDVSTGVLDVKIDAASVNTGSHKKDDKLKSKDFFNVKNDPCIRFYSNKIVQPAPHTFDIQGVFTKRGVSKPDALVFIADREAPGTGEINGTMAYDRKKFCMDSEFLSFESPTVWRSLSISKRCEPMTLFCSLDSSQSSRN